MAYDKSANDYAIRLCQLNQAHEALQNSHIQLDLRRRLMANIRAEQGEITLRLRTSAEQMPE